MNILIVGGAGYLGGAITDQLVSSGHNILVYDILLYEEAYRKRVPFICGDIRDEKKIKPHLEWADAVIWLAALVGDSACALNENLTREININSVRYLRDNFSGRIIYFSTCSVYGAQDDLLDEKSPLKPLSLYAESKLAAEKIFEGSGDTLILRLATLYGISDDFSRIRFDLVLNTLVMRSLIHKKINIFGGRQYRPLLHVRDAARLVTSAADMKNSGIYNLHCENTTILELAERIKKYFPGVESEIREAPLQDSRNYRVSSDKAKKELSFSPVLTIEDGIKELKELLNEGRLKNSFLSRFSNYLYLRPLLREYRSPLGKVIKINV